MTQSSQKTKEPMAENVLDPVNRTSEILFGLIMVLSFTCSLSAYSAGHSDIREMLIGALGCNVAWGIIDAFFYLMNLAAQRGRERLLIQKLKNLSDRESAQELFQNIIPESILGSLTPTSYREIRDHLLRNESILSAPLISLSDLRAALIVFLLVFLTTFPVAIPFLVMDQAWRALRISNLVALLLLFSLGYSLGHYAGRRSWIWGIGMTVIGASLVSITIALGG